MRFRAKGGGRIDRTKRLRFTFNGRSYEGFAGDTLASALIANGTHLTSRSFKYHRPRGILTAGAEEPSALVQLGRGARTEPNLRATQVELFDGLTAKGVNAWPSAGFDLSAWTGMLSPLFPAGFYYKTFLWPASFWKRFYEPIIRRMAGLGHAPDGPDPDSYDKMHVHCDVLVVGGGPSGIAAALAAGETGARVILVDEQATLGGALLGLKHKIGGVAGAAWAAAARERLEAMPEVRVLTRTTLFGYYDHNSLSALERRTDHLGSGAGSSRISRQRLWNIKAQRVVLATGAHERPLVFADNDRPGIMLASAAQRYLNDYAALPGRRAVLFTNNDAAYEAAHDFIEAGGIVAAVVDSRPSPDAAFAPALRERSVPIYTDAVIAATHGAKRVRRVTVMDLGAEGKSVVGAARRIACDCVLVSGGWTPAVHLFCQSGGKLDFEPDRGMPVPGAPVQPLEVAGAARGSFALAACFAEGAAAGAKAAEAAGFGDGAMPSPPPVDAPAPGAITPLWLVPGRRPIGHGKAKHLVDHQDDVTAHDIRLAAREGFRSVEHVKRYTTVGMGSDQGKTANVNGLAILADTLGRTIPEVGTTTYRPPYTPVTFGALAGRDRGALMDPVRRTPMHEWHAAHGAEFENVGQWHRPWWYLKQGEDNHAAVARECLAVRGAVGVLDASTLGKIDIQGPDAATLLNRVYTNAWSKLEVGRARYGLMCHDDGMVFDDGTTARLGENHFVMTTTTGNAAVVLDWLEEWLQTEWPELEVYCTSVTEQWATMALAGPKSREVLAAVAPDLPLDADAFPFMSVREAIVAGVPARVFRISFTGELSFEINVPWHHGLHVWEKVMAAGEDHGITPYGTEAMHVLRAERGFIIVGQETDGTTTPQDLGMDWIVSKKKPDFLGKRAWSRDDNRREDRKQLVGILTEDPSVVLPEGAQLIDKPGQPPVPMIGHVTSSYGSPTLGRSIALALVRGGRARKGDTVYASLADRTVRCVVSDPVFYDPEGAKRDG
jgi:sarcosine oxidase subunit alpha